MPFRILETIALISKHRKNNHNSMPAINIADKIQHIVNLCIQTYKDKDFFDQHARNRHIILQPLTAQHLTSDVILYLYQNPEPELTQFTSSDGQKFFLQDIIKNGLSDEEFIYVLGNRDSDCTEEGMQIIKGQYNENTKRVLHAFDEARSKVVSVQPLIPILATTSTHNNCISIDEISKRHRIDLNHLLPLLGIPYETLLDINQIKYDKELSSEKLLSFIIETAAKTPLFVPKEQYLATMNFLPALSKQMRQLSTTPSSFFHPSMPPTSSLMKSLKLPSSAPAMVAALPESPMLRRPPPPRYVLTGHPDDDDAYTLEEPPKQPYNFHKLILLAASYVKSCLIDELNHSEHNSVLRTRCNEAFLNYVNLLPERKRDDVLSTFHIIFEKIKDLRCSTIDERRNNFVKQFIDELNSLFPMEKIKQFQLSVTEEKGGMAAKAGIKTEDFNSDCGEEKFLFQSESESESNKTEAGESEWSNCGEEDGVMYGTELNERVEQGAEALEIDIQTQTMGPRI